MDHGMSVNSGAVIRYFFDVEAIVTPLTESPVFHSLWVVKFCLF